MKRRREGEGPAEGGAPPAAPAARGGGTAAINALSGWLELAADDRGGGRARAEEIMLARLQISLQKSFDPVLADRALEDAASAPPAWLLGVLRSPQCRRLLAALAAQHPDCRLLSFAAAAGGAGAAGRSPAGSGLEPGDLGAFLQRLEAAAVAVLDAVSAGRRPPTAGDSHAHAALCHLCELCCATDFGFVLALYLLQAVEDQSRSTAATAARRLVQDVFSFASSGGLSLNSRAARRDSGPKRQLQTCARAVRRRQCEASGALAAVEATGTATMSDAECLRAALTATAPGDAEQAETAENGDEEAIAGFPSRPFFVAMLAALFNPVGPAFSLGARPFCVFLPFFLHSSYALAGASQGKQLEARQSAAFIDVLAIAATGKRPRAELRGQTVDALQSAVAACREVQLGGSGYSVVKLCAAATEGARAAQDDASAARGANPGWLDVPVAAAGLLVWARLYLEVSITRCDSTQQPSAPVGYGLLS